MSQTNITATITYDSVNKEYVAAVNKMKASGKRTGYVVWTLDRKDKFPKNAKVILQFVDRDTQPKVNVDGPMDDAKTSHGRYETTGQNINTTVGNSATGRFFYTLSYDDGGTERLLLDPELIIDGNAPAYNDFLRRIKAGFRKLVQSQREQARRDSARAKSKKAKPGKKAAPAKKAKKR
jgi:hypothetical protein